MLRVNRMIQLTFFPARLVRSRFTWCIVPFRAIEPTVVRWFTQISGRLWRREKSELPGAIF